MTGLRRAAALTRRSPGHGSVPRGARHIQQFQLAVLELERARRRQERDAAQRRLAEIDARLAEIEAAVRAKQDALAAVEDGEGVPSGPLRTSPATRSIRY
jgi:hypothetical protein